MFTFICPPRPPLPLVPSPLPPLPVVGLQSPPCEPLPVPLAGVPPRPVVKVSEPADEDVDAPPVPFPVFKLKVPVPDVPTVTAFDPFAHVCAVPLMASALFEESISPRPLAVEYRHAFCEHELGAVPVAMPMTLVPFATAAFVEPI